MTGIERLRKVAGLFHGPTMSSTLANDLNDIADQIEREARAPFSRLLVLAAVGEMERYASAHRCEDDSPVCRWAHKLRKALDAGRDPAADVSMSAYDLLPPDERDAIAWVREHGGIEHVRSQWAYLRGRANHADHVDRQLAKRQRQIDESHAALRRRNELLGQYKKANETLLERGAKMKRRLMPEGMEWPRWDDGKLVTYDDSPDDVIGVYLALDGSGYALMTDLPDQLMSEPSERVKRPAPKALDADGAEIRARDHVWHVETGQEYVVVSICYEDGIVVIRAGDKTSEYEQYVPSQLTHRAPILAADGKPLREGETVWLTDGSERHVVLSTEKDAVGNIVTEVQAPGAIKVHISPSRLTHERPESKCRDCAHWQKDPTADKLGVCWFYYHEHEGQDCYTARLGDIGACEEFMPRGKALAERGQ